MSVAAPSVEPFDDPTWASCHVVVGAFDDIAPAVRRAVLAASAAVQREPDLADVIDLRFADAGPRLPLSADEAGRVAQGLVAQTTQPSRTAPETYVALLVVDDRGVAAANLVVACRVEFASLGIDGRVVGVAVKDDGAPADGIAILGPGANVETRLTEEILRQARALLKSTARRPGLSPQILAELQPLGPDETLEERSRVGDTVPVGTTLATANEPAAGSPVADIAERERISPTGPGQATPQRIARARVIIAAFAQGQTRRQWSAARKMLLSLDQQLARDAATPELVLISSPKQGATPPRPAGELRRRDLDRPDDLTEPAALWRALEQQVTADRRPASSVTTVVIVALSAPLADVAAVDAYARLTAHTSPIWLLAGADRGLFSDVYIDGRQVIDSDTATLDELAAALSQPRTDA